MLWQGACIAEGMMQSPVSPRAPKTPPSLIMPPAVDPVLRREHTRAALAGDEANAVVFQEPKMESAVKPLIWLLIPFVATLVYGFVSS